MDIPSLVLAALSGLDQDRQTPSALPSQSSHNLSAEMERWRHREVWGAEGPVAPE